MNRNLKITLITLLIILISIISFVGLFIQNTKFMDNILPDYNLGMDLRGYRAVTVEVSDETETIYYDKDGNIVDEEAEDGTSEQIPVNNEEDLTGGNYLRTKQIVEKRLEELEVSEYLIRLNEENGTITVLMTEDDKTDLASQFIYQKGEFTLEDEDGQVLLDNSNLKRVTYQLPNSGNIYTTVNFEFNDESVERLKEITNTYVESEDEEGNDTSKSVLMKIDGTTILETSFSEEISNGVLTITFNGSYDEETLEENNQEAKNMANLLNNGILPLEYTVEQNRFFKSDITFENMFVPLLVIGVILLLSYIFLIIRYKKLGILAIIAHIGYLAIYLLIIRVTNLVLTIEGIYGIIAIAILNYIFLVYILEKLKKCEKDLLEYKKAFNKSVLTMILILIPAIIVGIVFSFAKWLPAFSFGTIMFWGILIIYIYNASITRVLFLNSINESKK